jgi:hypothetical protein
VEHMNNSYKLTPYIVNLPSSNYASTNLLDPLRGRRIK